ncbi:MAG: EAL domain-containing protein [Spirochaetia bacterium]|nr:EAL domain-containing protein [Spirochaetia bacterium]
MIKKKLFISMFALAILAVLSTGIIGYFIGKDRISKEIFNKLTSIKENKKISLKLYFDDKKSEIKTLALSEATAAALREFNKGYLLSDKNIHINKKNEESLKAYFEENFFTKIKAENSEDKIKPFDFYKPQTGAVYFLQNRYISENRHPAGEKDKLVAPKNKSYYDVAHERFHPYFRKFIKERGYYDVFLIDYQTGNIVYSVFKEIDFATSLVNGPFKFQSIGKLFNKIKSEPIAKDFYYIDFDQYEPSYNRPAAFIASPIKENEKIIGILIFQLSIDEINKIMTADKRWKEEGLENTGESYFVCDDYRMRNDSRFLIEKKDEYFKSLDQFILLKNIRDNIKNFNTTILFQPAAGRHVKMAMQGQSGQGIFEDYRKESVLASYGPVELYDKNCAIISKVDLYEAFSPINDFRNWILIISLFLFIPAFITALYFSKKISYPIMKLAEGIKYLSKGEKPEKIQINSKDEIEYLAESYNELIDKLEKTTVSRDYMNEILTSLSDILIIVSLIQKNGGYETRIKKVNISAENILEYSENELTGKSADIIFLNNSENYIFSKSKIEELFDFGYLSADERVLRKKNKEKVPVLLSATLIKDQSSEEIHVICVAQDLSVFKKTQKALEKSQDFLKRAQRIGHLGSWEWDMVENNLSWSDEVYRIFGVEPQSFGATYEAFLNYVHPDDRDMVTNGVNVAIKNHDAYKVNHRVVRSDGSIRIVLEMGEVYYENDNPVKMIGTVHDITDIKQTENELLAAKEVFNNSIEGVMVTDEKGNIEYVNKAFTDITGYKPEEAIGQTPALLRADDQDEKIFSEMWSRLEKERKWEGEIWNRKKSGEAYPQWLTISAFQDAFGKTNRYIGIFHDLTEIKKKEEEAVYHSSHDPLTKLANKHLLTDRLEQSIKQNDKNHLIGVAFVGIDRFKNINDSFGHSAGDKLLKEISEKLRKVINENDIISRFGGDEFAFVLRDKKNLAEIINSLHLISSAFSQAFNISDKKLYITASIGASVFPNDGKNANELLTRANTAMSRAKKSGDKKILMYTETMNTVNIKRLELETEIRKAIANNEFVPFYQPKLNIKTGKITGAEALIRWIHPEKGIISPGEFIPIAEETGMISAMGEIVLNKTCEDVRRLTDLGYKDISIAVNLAAAQLFDSQIIEKIKSVIEKNKIKPEQLGIELTETSLMNDMQNAINIMNKLKEMNITIYIDDFGTGYSSLNYLKQFPITALKIDQSFVKNMLEHPEDASIVSAVISMGHNLGLKVIAEGVETEDELQFLQESKCDEMQGYLFSPPVKKEDFIEMLKSGRSIKESVY